MRKKNKKINNFSEWMYYMLAYALVILIMTRAFDSIYIYPKYTFFICLLIVILLYILKKTVKPLLVLLTIPITALTLGTFYLFINLFMLKLVDWMLFGLFDLNGFWTAFFFSILISIVNYLVDDTIEGIKRR
ncbi:MAG: phage holin family protein [Bacilli bacterium]|nr:phage holin family protein [Bacilli bacterium]